VHLKKLGAKDLADEFLDQKVHVFFACRSKTSLALFNLEFIVMVSLKESHLPCIKLIELLLVELCHDSEAASVEKEIKLLVVLFRACIGFANLSLLSWFFASRNILRRQAYFLFFNLSVRQLHR
jgi:hypothetical protein